MREPTRRGPSLSSCVIVYAKRPLPGHAKTRLAAGMGDEAAAGVYARLLYGYLTALVASIPPDTGVCISLASVEDVPYFRRAFPECEVVAQAPGDLGQRLAASFDAALSQGATRVVLTGSDIPGLGATLVADALHALGAADGPSGAAGGPSGAADVVLGPAEDGGYYLVGMRAPGVDLFRGVAWSTDRVLAQTLALAVRARARVALLPALADMDDLLEYERWAAERQSVDSE